MKMRVLAGDAAEPDLGTDIEVHVTDEVRGQGMVPFVRLVGPEGGRRIVVGAAVVAARIDVTISAAWSESGGWHQEPWQGDLGEALRHPGHRIPDDAMRRRLIAKAIAEGSRNTVSELRSLRYEMERQIADLLAQRRDTALRMVMAQLVELSMVVSRARDHVREAIREGQHAHGNEPALRHCHAMELELGEEITRLQSLLTSMSTFAVAQEGEVQQRFNMLAAAAAAGLGLPALILSLYGADDYLPFTWDKAWRALAPIAGALTIAAGVILHRMPGRTTAKHYLTALGLISGLIGVLLVAGLLAPG